MQQAAVHVGAKPGDAPSCYCLQRQRCRAATPGCRLTSEVRHGAAASRQGECVIREKGSASAQESGPGSTAVGMCSTKQRSGAERMTTVLSRCAVNESFLRAFNRGRECHSGLQSRQLRRWRGPGGAPASQPRRATWGSRRAGAELTSAALRKAVLLKLGELLGAQEIRLADVQLRMLRT